MSTNSAGRRSALALLVLLCACSAPKPGWNQSYANSRNSSFEPVHTTDFTTPKWEVPLWTAPADPNELLEYAPSAPVVAPDGSILVAGEKVSSANHDENIGRLACFEPDGSKRFDIKIGAGRESTPAVTSNGHIVVVSMSADKEFQIGTPKNSPSLTCVDGKGNFHWMRWLCPGGSVATVGDRVAASPPKILAGKEETIFVLTSTNTEIWLCALSTNGDALDSRQVFGTPPPTNPDVTARWLLPPAVIESHPSAAGPVVFVAVENCPLQVFGWHEPTRTFSGFYNSWPNPLSTNRLAAPVLSANGVLVVAAMDSLSAYDMPVAGPTWQCPALFPVPAEQRPPGLFLDGAHFNLYAALDDKLALVRSCAVEASHPVPGPSAPVVTWDRVHVSAVDGLHTFDFSLSPASHVVAPLADPNRRARQPALAQDGTLYECTLGPDASTLRAFGGPGAPTPPPR